MTSYSILTTSSLPSASPWRQRKTKNSPSWKPQFQENQTAASPSAYTGSPHTHTDQYLAYDPHHPQSVKRGIVKSLYERAKRLVTKPSVISKDKKHLSSVLGYPFSFLQKITMTGKPNSSAEPANEFKGTAVLPYVKGLSEQLRRCLQQQGVRVIFNKISANTTKRRCRPG